MIGRCSSILFTDPALDGAFGDDCNNSLDARNYNKSAILTGEAGDDYLYGGYDDDFISGGAGAVRLYGYDGDGVSLHLRYVQVFMLDFFRPREDGLPGRARWPHISIATLKKESESY